MVARPDKIALGTGNTEPDGDLPKRNDMKAIKRLILVMLIVGKPEHEVFIGFRNDEGPEPTVPDTQSQAEVLVPVLLGDAVMQLMIVRAQKNSVQDPSV